MKKKTEALAKKIAGEAFLERFLLVGETALSVYLEHRLEEEEDTMKRIQEYFINLLELENP